nr:MAG TPA: helix-turn-helix domain protein [Caudoviricetes sp.]
MIVETQCARVLKYLKENESITAMEALNELGIFRLASRICDLRQSGVEISDRWKEVENRFGEKCRIKEYFLAK